jgi:hypothetical protein
LTVDASAANIFSISVSKSHVDWLLAAFTELAASAFFKLADSATASSMVDILGVSVATLGVAVGADTDVAVELTVVVNVSEEVVLEDTEAITLAVSGPIA